MTQCPLFKHPERYLRLVCLYTFPHPFSFSFYCPQRMQEICKHDWQFYKKDSGKRYRSFEQITMENIPEQKSVSSASLHLIFLCFHLPQLNVQNGTECGVFTLFYAYCIAADIPFNFGLNDCGNLRRKIFVELMKGEITQFSLSE